ncbi:MAG: class I fructose-bisphosphate aldolase [Acidimicrobiales bacterium]
MTSSSNYAAHATSAVQAGKDYRMGRIFGADGKTVVLPLDHGSMLGRVPGLEDPVAALERFASLSCDGFLVGPGVAARSAGLFARRDAPARLLTIDSYWNAGEAGTSAMIASVATASALGVDAVKVLMPWNVPAPGRALVVNLVSSVVEAAAPLGMPVMVEPIAYEMGRGPEASKIEADGCRVAMEAGADILKVAYPGDPATLEAWCSELHLPIVMLGGPQGGATEELLSMVSDAVKAGASGVVIGRRVWQRPPDEAARLLEKLYGVVHSGQAAD